jgi:hypothetical protein
MENPELERFDAKKAFRECAAKCQGSRPGWNPTATARDACIDFCTRLKDADEPQDVSPQPAQRSWWQHHGEHYDENQAADASSKPYDARSSSSSHSSPHSSSHSSSSSNADQEEKSKENEEEKEEAEGGPATAAGKGAPRAKLGQGLLADSAGSSGGTGLTELLELPQVNGRGAHGLDGVSFGSKASRSDINSYFDSLPTTGCETADCNAPSSAAGAKRAGGEKHKAVGGKQLAKMERGVLGYHRRREREQEDKELASISKESDSLVDATAKGEGKSLPPSPLMPFFLSSPLLSSPLLCSGQSFRLLISPATFGSPPSPLHPLLYPLVAIRNDNDNT